MDFDQPRDDDHESQEDSEPQEKDKNQNHNSENSLPVDKDVASDNTHSYEHRGDSHHPDEAKHHTSRQAYNDSETTTTPESSYNSEHQHPSALNHVTDSNSNIQAPEHVFSKPPAKNIDTNYISNPFLNAARGVVTMLRVNPATSMLSSLVIFLAFFVFYPIVLLSFSSQNFILGGIVLLIVLICFVPYTVALMVGIGLKSKDAQTVSLGDSSSSAFKKIIPMIGLLALTYIATVLGLLLFIVPGIIIIARACLAPYVLIDEGVGPVVAFKRSFALTKGHSIEMLGSLLAGSLMSGGYLLAPALSTAPLLGRYSDILELKQSRANKPETDSLNYLALIFLVLAVIGIIFIAGLLALVGLISHSNNFSSNSSFMSQSINQTIKPGSNSQNPAQGTKVASAWLKDIQSGDIHAAYLLEDTNYQQQYSVAQQSLIVSPLIVPNTSNTLISSITGLASDHTTQQDTIVYKSTNASSMPYYIEIDVQLNGEVWQVSSYMTSDTLIQPSSPV